MTLFLWQIMTLPVYKNGNSYAVFTNTINHDIIIYKDTL